MAGAFGRIKTYTYLDYRQSMICSAIVPRSRLRGFLLSGRLLKKPLPLETQIRGVLFNNLLSLTPDISFDKTA